MVRGDGGRNNRAHAPDERDNKDVARRTRPELASEPRTLSLPSLGDHPKIKDVIYQELRERIAFGDFSPGDRLVEADLATRFGVSKTPVREALLTLEAERLVVLRPHRGAEVSRLTVEEWTELIFLRDAIEIGALDEIIAEMAEPQFVAAEAALVEMADAWAEHDYRRYRRVQRQLHAIILGAPGYAMLKETALQLNDRLDRYGRLLVTRDQARWADDLEMNRRRIELIRQRDARTYTRLVKGRHADSTRAMKKLTGQAEARPGPVRGKGRSVDG